MESFASALNAGLQEGEQALQYVPRASSPEAVPSIEDLFGIIIKHGLTGSDYQKLLFAIFTALSEVIREQQQMPTPTAYFAVIMTSLTTENRKAEDKVVAAQVYLLQIAMSGCVPLPPYTQRLKIFRFCA